MNAVKYEKAFTKQRSLDDDLAAVAKIDAIPRILEVACHATGLRFATVARVTEERWIACAVRDEIAFGLEPGDELPIKTTLCDEVRVSGQVVVIENAAQDEFFSGHPTPRQYGFESYISVPIYLPSGQFFGTLCAFDPRPAPLRIPATIEMFRLFADLIAFHLDAQERLAVTQSALQDERHLAQLREQFIAVLGHDLRNPLNAISLSVPALLRTPLPENALPIVRRLQNSAKRMAGLIDNILDFAQTRMGSGLALTRLVVGGLKETLDQVIAELQAVRPDRIIHTDIDLRQPVVCDGSRIAQLFSNLLANALTHGAPDIPVRVWAHSDGSVFELSVGNGGKPIPPDALDQLFEPFSRASVQADQKGLGLGLYIAAEIARAHQGSLTVVSSVEETRFTFRMPVSSNDSR